MDAPQKGDLSAAERKVLQVIAAGDVQEAAQLLASKEVRVNCLDEQLWPEARLTNPLLCQIVMLVKENPVLVDVAALEKCYQVMDLLCEQCVKQQDMNEVLAMKMHYISCVLQKCVAFLHKRDEKLDTLVKCLLKGRDGDGFPQYQEKFIRDCIRKFPYCEVTLLQQLVRSIAPVEIGNDPTAYTVLTQALTGQVVFVDADYCATCGDRGAEKRCSFCKAVTYCSLMCQKLHWFTHNKTCRSLQEQDADLEKDAPRLKEIKDDESNLVMETANFLQELCLRAEEKYGMTPLMHAAYNGKADMCRLLLQHGADVNCNQHEYGYTALMFAGLSGKTDITSMMLDAGAETDLVNSVGRTAAQMAAFVGQHDCVTVINNFFSRARLEYYTRPQGQETEPKLPPRLAGPLHKIIMTTNLNPVKVFP
ncbi:ankyrin repeat and MYND domain-containing protein 2-like [Stegastes partitus]|uniref:Ankyrin repeat and MYND domain-containing protein 2-like n=1 Tax=Stegastes partitus TaxID=144197 RepID=A0A9Y4MSV4_9TELE|nr:PREDICTED: ankyrin repeat and MYND domain-containing protein 2-like [Stegastes partitus]